MACLLPQAHKGQFEEHALEAEGNPETQPARLPPGSDGSSHQVVESSRACAQEQTAAVLLDSRSMWMSLREAGALPGGVLCRAEAMVVTLDMPLEGLPPSWACRPLRALAGPRDGAPTRTCPACGRAQRFAGWGPSPSPRTSSPAGSTSSLRCSTDEEVELECRRCAHAPRTRPRARAATTHTHVADLARLQRPPPRSHALSAPPLTTIQCPEQPNAQPALRGRSLGLRAR